MFLTIIIFFLKGELTVNTKESLHAEPIAHYDHEEGL